MKKIIVLPFIFLLSLTSLFASPGDKHCTIAGHIDSYSYHILELIEVEGNNGTSLKLSKVLGHDLKFERAVLELSVNVDCKIYMPQDTSLQHKCEITYDEQVDKFYIKQGLKHFNLKSPRVSKKEAIRVRKMLKQINVCI